MNLVGRSHDSYYISLVDLLTLSSPLKDKKWGKDNQLSSTTLEITTQLAVRCYSGCMAIWPPGCLAIWAISASQKPLLSGPPLPAAVHHKLLVVETPKLFSKRTEIIVALYSGPTGEEKKHFNPCRPRKKSKMMRNPPIKWENVFLLQKCWLRSFEDEKSSSLMSSSTMIYTMRKLSHYY